MESPRVPTDTSDRGRIYVLVDGYAVDATLLLSNTGLWVSNQHLTGVHST